MANLRDVMERESVPENLRYVFDMPDDAQHKEIRRIMPSVRREVAEKEKELETLRRLEGSYAAAGALIEYWENAPTPVLQRNEHSRLHLLKAAARKGAICGGEGWEDIDSDCRAFVDSVEHTFVVRHNWAEMLADVDEGEIRLPYERCAFELMVSGFPIIAVCDQEPIDEARRMTLFMTLEGFWCPFNAAEGNTNGQRLLDFCWQQIRAICVALDSEVATHEVVRVSRSLNEKRERKGRIPLPDYRVVDLSKRHRIANPTGGSSGGKVRLHFRRGHWRHFADHKTWIRWQLVGNPDLGFVGKHYKL